MDQLSVILGAVGTVFSVIGLGLLLRWLGWLTEEADQSLIRLTVRVFFPALITNNIARNPDLTPQWDLLIAISCGVGMVMMGFAVSTIFSHFFARILELDTRSKLLTFILCTGIFNFAYIPIPLAMAMYNTHGQTMSILLIHNVGVEFTFYTVGIAILTGKIEKQALKGIANPMAIAMIVALALNWSHVWISPHFPDWLRTLINWLGAAAVPVSLLLVGATIGDVWRAHKVTSGFKTILGASLIRLVILPILMLSIGYLLPISTDLKRVFVLQAAMPAAAFSVVLAKHYNKDVPTAVRIVLWTHIISLITIPLWLIIGTHWLDV